MFASQTVQNDLEHWGIGNGKQGQPLFCVGNKVMVMHSHFWCTAIIHSIFPLFLSQTLQYRNDSVHLRHIICAYLPLTLFLPSRLSSKKKSNRHLKQSKPLCMHFHNWLLINIYCICGECIIYSNCFLLIYLLFFL